VRETSSQLPEEFEAICRVYCEAITSGRENEKNGETLSE